LLTGKTSITVNTGTGNDTINVGAFTTQLPTLTLNGGTGDDLVNLNGNITFKTNAHLDINLKNDDPAPGADAVTFGANAVIRLSGTGTGTVKTNKHVTLNSGSIQVTSNGNLTVEVSP
jgi:mucin-19